jgi:hypothetical protein
MRVKAAFTRRKMELPSSSFTGRNAVASITTAHPFLAKHKDKIHGVLSCFDRVIIRGHLPLSYPKGLEGFLYQQNVLLKNFKDYAPQIADRVRDHVKAIVEKAGAPYRHLPSKEPMEEIARKMAEEKKITEGIVCGFSQLETCRSFRFEYAKGLPRLRLDYRKCSVLYVFLMHRVLGLIHVKIQTWFPLTMQVYVNGHDYLAKRLDELGVKYGLYDNAFTWIADVAAAQRCADRFARLNWPKLLRQLARQFNPLMGKELLWRDYYWVMDQAEYATDVMFKEASGLEGLYRRMVEHARACLSAEDVLRFLGRKPNPCFKGEIQTHVTRRVEGVRVVHRMTANKLKMYDKGGIVLRVETTINRPREFRIWRKTADGKGLAWQPMLKGVAWMWRYAEVSRAANARYLETMAVVDDDSAARRLLDRGTKPAQLDGRRKRALQPLSPADQELFLAVMRGEHRLKGFRNRDIAGKLYPKKTDDPLERRRRCGRVTRLIQLLRAHGLVGKIPHTRRYRVLRDGEMLMGAAIKTMEINLPRHIHEAA